MKNLRFLPLYCLYPLLLAAGTTAALAQGPGAPQAAPAAAPGAPALPVPAVMPPVKPIAFPAGPLTLDTTLETVLAGKVMPASIRLRDLDGAWQRVTVSMTAPSASSTLAMMTGNSGGGSDAFYTRADMVTIAGEHYLLGYKLQVKFPSIFEMSMAAAQGHKQNTQKVDGTTTMTLALLNMRQIAAFSEMRPFKLEQEIIDAVPVIPGMDQPGPAGDGQAEASVSNLKQIGLAVVQYSQDHGQKIPSIPDSATARKSLAGYLGDEKVLKQPGNGQPYVPNDKLSGAKLDKIDNPSEVVLFYEAGPADDGYRAVLFADGHVKRVKETQFGGLRMEPLLAADHP